MKNTAYAFSVAAIRVRETSLLSRSDFESLIASPDEKSALRILEDRGYNGITEDTEGVLSEKLREVTDYIMDISPDKSLLSFLFIKNDFHNLKAAMKCAVSGTDPKKYFLPSAIISEDDVIEAVNEKNFSDLPEMFRHAAREAWDGLVAGMNGQLCEMILDRAAIDTEVTVTEKSGDEFCAGLAKLKRKLLSFMIAYRCAAAGKSRDFVMSSLPDVTEVSKNDLVQAALAGCDEVTALAVKCGISLPDVPDASDIRSALERIEDEYTSGSIYVSMGISPIISYYLKTTREVSKIRMILSCKRGGFSDEIIRKRTGL